MNRHTTGFRMRPAFAALALAVGVWLAPGGSPAVAGPFTAMTGSWSGDGKLAYANGTSERLRCRASYAVGRDGDSVDFRIRCASDTYNIDLSGFMSDDGGTVSGQWSEPNYNSAGNLTGKSSGNRVNANAVGNTFSARLSLTTGANQQSVTIKPSTENITQITLSFRKG
jgi:hypothetical protein